MLAHWTTTDVLEAEGDLTITEGISRVDANGEYAGVTEPIAFLAATFEGRSVKVDTNGGYYVRNPDGSRTPIRVRIVAEEDRAPYRPTYRQAITTRFAGPTDRRGSRVIARSEAGRVSVPWDATLDVEANHAAAAAALADRLGWSGDWFGGWDGGGYVFVVASPRCAPAFRT